MPFNLAFNYYIMLHYFLAACFMYLLLRHFQLKRTSAFLGGVIFAFSGYLLSVSNMNTSLSSVIWLPLVILFFDRLLKKMNFLNIAVLGILLAMQFLGGEPTVIYVTLFFLIAYGASFSGSWQLFVKNLGGLILSGTIALGLTAVQLLPFLELASLSDRVVRTAYGLITFRSFPPREIITFLFPYFYGNPAQFGGYTATLLGKTIQDWLISPYLGILPLIFIFLSFNKDKKQALFFAVAAIISVILSFGKYTPLYRMVYFIPGFSIIRYPVKYLFMSTFCLVVLASFGFDWLQAVFEENKEKLLKVLRVIFPTGIILTLIFIFVYFFRLQIFLFVARSYPPGLPKYFFDLLARIIEFNLISFLFIILYLFGFSLILLMAYKRNIKRSVFILLISLLVIADLFSNGSNIAVSVSSDVFSRVPESLEILLRGEGLYRFFYTPELENQNRTTYGESYDSALLESKDNLAANWHIPYRLFDFLGYESIKPAWLFHYYAPNFNQEKIRQNFKYLSRFNVKYVASSEKLNIPYLKLLRHKEKYGLDLFLYENPRVYPRAYILDPERKPDLVGSNASIIKYMPDQIEILAELRKGGYLFISEAYYPGWRVFVDGKESQISRGMEYFREVELSAGKHKIKFVYDPLSFKLGSYLSLATIFGLLLGGLIYFRKNK
jgi:hypothetical protein